VCVDDTKTGAVGNPREWEEVIAVRKRQGRRLKQAIAIIVAVTWAATAAGVSQIDGLPTPAQTPGCVVSVHNGSAA
jgi:hypothetical protein